MDRAINRIFLVGTLLMIALMGNLVWLQVFHAKALQHAPENHRLIAQQLRVKRGLIQGFDGSTIVGDAQRSGFYSRTYPQGPLAPQIVGYDSVRYGLTGIESSMNAYLSGADLGTQGLIDKVLGRHSPGANVRLTIVPAVQKVAQSALGSQVGAIVALDPSTGAIIVAASAPSYDPATIDTSFARLSKDAGAPLLSRVTQGLYPPGSSFKVVTATAALNLGKVTPTTSFDDTGTYAIDGGKVTNYHGEVFGTHDFTEALTDSVNTTFAKVGTLIGQQALIAQMRAYGFYQTPPLELPRGMVYPSGRFKGPHLLSAGAAMIPARRGLGRRRSGERAGHPAADGAGGRRRGRRRPGHEALPGAARHGALGRGAAARAAEPVDDRHHAGHRADPERHDAAGRERRHRLRRRPVGHPGGGQDRHGAARQQQRRLVHRLRAGRPSQDRRRGDHREHAVHRRRRGRAARGAGHQGGAGPARAAVSGGSAGQESMSRCGKLKARSF